MGTDYFKVKQRERITTDTPIGWDYCAQSPRRKVLRLEKLDRKARMRIKRGGNEGGTMLDGMVW